MRQKLRRRLKMMAVIPRTDFIQGQFAFEPKKNSGSYKTTKHRLRKLFLFLRHQESEDLWLFKFTQNWAKKFVYKRLANPASQAKKGKLIIIKNSISTDRIILK